MCISHVIPSLQIRQIWSTGKYKCEGLTFCLMEGFPAVIGTGCDGVRPGPKVYDVSCVFFSAVTVNTKKSYWQLQKKRVLAFTAKKKNLG